MRGAYAPANRTVNGTGTDRDGEGGGEYPQQLGAMIPGPYGCGEVRKRTRRGQQTATRGRWGVGPLTTRRNGNGTPGGGTREPIIPGRTDGRWRGGEGGVPPPSTQIYGQGLGT